ncbi:hypothetical protein [Nostoc sp.]|uniref:hypothetical protein n=1 Tax=Nostoc sp. TaxID=1180 RepID=UPI002FF97721
MSNLTFDKSLAFSLYQSDEQFPINLNNAWQWLGYTNKRNCADMVKSNFIINEDFLRGGSKSNGGRPSEVLLLSIECFKCLAMMAGTEQGKVIRKYFLECERIAKGAIAKPHQAQLATGKRLSELMSKEVSTRQQIKELETELASKRRELQSVMQELLVEAKAYRDANAEVMQQSLLVKEIIDRVKQGNPYLSV